MSSARSAMGVIVFVGTVWMGSAPAIAVPQQLLNKTVTLSWTTQSVQRSSDGKERQVNSSIRYIIYISSLGRLFERSSRSAGSRTQVGDADPNARNTKMGEARGMRFEGNALVANRGYSGAGGSGAMRAVATFDPSFSSCTLAVTHGRENGGVIKRKGLDGVVREYLSLTVTGSSCSIQNGNGLAS
ncbi:hypothetical protein KMZ29_20800 [Bradyrhizobium sediminis]|uniref:Uncharacterized protein n=1 Tax=Bradyrhizobium sediminis TaxID=2840469 RepID=A0A975RM53_9BRAD|nr:hypothetical protein [Bradyrhizobium sediminis]QWG12136.1 hypothetical protein KMZ29_20800 [Bradyrhizobium sediminis]